MAGSPCFLGSPKKKSTTIQILYEAVWPGSQTGQEFSAGKKMENVLPLPTVLSTWTVPL